jgi:IPT/TIG domain
VATAVTITGANFQSGPTVNLGSAAATNVTVVNSTTITATTPANAGGPVNVTVTNPDSQTSAIQPIANAGFELGNSGWVAGGSGAVGIITNATQAHHGNNFVQVTSAPGNHPFLNSILAGGNSPYLPVNPGDLITFGGWTSRGAGDGVVHWVLQITDANKSNPVYISTANVSSNSWTFLQNSSLIPSTGRFVRFSCEIYNNSVSAVANFDDAVLIYSAQGAIFNYLTPPILQRMPAVSGYIYGGVSSPGVYTYHYDNMRTSRIPAKRF